MSAALAMLGLRQGATAATCPSGAEVAKAETCKLFRKFVDPVASNTDSRIVSRLKPEEGAPPIRNFALIVGVDTYPNFPPGQVELSPAKHDLDRLEPFFERQKFDEIIELRNGEASRDNIDYFLRDYLPSQLRYYGPGARVVFVFIGHGAPGVVEGEAGSIVLGLAKSANDYANTYPLADLTPKLALLGKMSHHFLALLGSCYSGGVFTQVPASGDNIAYPGGPGAHAVSATKADDLAYGLGGESGSIFFDALIDGVETGDADMDYAGWVTLPNGDRHRIGGGIVRLGSLTSYISSRLDRLSDAYNRVFPQIRYGMLTATRGKGGAFFFLGPERRKEVVADGRAALPVPDARVLASSIPQHPEIKVFNAPDSYPISGVDVNHWNGRIDWDLVKDQGFTFAYMKATEGRLFQDPEFDRNWEASRAAGIVRGAYHVFRFCQSPQAQFENIKQTVPLDPEALPPAIQVYWYGGPTTPGEKGCNDVRTIRDNLQTLAQSLKTFYGKRPVIHGPGSLYADILDDTFSQYPVWLRDYKDNPSKKARGLSLPGNNPWTVWQFTSGGEVRGIETGLRVDLNAFFGSPSQFAEFQAGLRNPALEDAR